MKLLASSSSSPTFSFDPTLCSFKTAITTFFHRIICSSGLQTHPSEQIRELHSKFIASEKVQNLNTSSTIVSSSPVARLMGLDSMVGSSVSHSRSLNSVNSVSQGFHLVENENFLVFSFESGGENSKFKSKGRRKEKGCVELKKKKRENVNVGSDGEFQFEKSLFMEDGNCEKVKKRKKGKICCVEKKIENECCSEDSSPVSVFDFECDVSRTGLFLQFEFNFCFMVVFVYLVHV
jgi:phosphotransferase system HPr-like phosphotransfer protein